MHELEVLYIDGEYHVHAAGCRDVKRNLHRQDGGANIPPIAISAVNDADVARDLWGDIASDDYAMDTDEWEEECMNLHNSYSRIYPCVKY